MPRIKGEKNAASWPDEHVETLKRLWGQGKTAGAIADVLPYSRSAVCAAARRHGLEPRPRAVPELKPDEKIRKMVGLVAENNFPLRTAAERSRVPFSTARETFDQLIARYDLGNRPSSRDDVVTPVRS